MYVTVHVPKILWYKAHSKYIGRSEVWKDYIAQINCSEVRSRCPVRVSVPTCIYRLVVIVAICGELLLSFKFLSPHWYMLAMSLPMSSTPAIIVTKLMIKEPSCDPIGTVILLGSETPIIIGVLISTTSDSVYCFVLPLLFKIIPVVRRHTRTMIFQVRLLRDQPAVDSSCLLLSWWSILAGEKVKSEPER